MDNDLLSLWLRADSLSAAEVRDLLTEVSAARQRKADDDKLWSDAFRQGYEAYRSRIGA